MKLALLLARRVHLMYQTGCRHMARSVEYSEAHLPMLGIMGTFGFPLYYVVWHDLIPQPYENWWLRLLGGLLFAPLIFTYPLASEPRCRRWLPLYFVGVIIYAVPFFFTFMLLMNGSSPVWIATTVAGLLLLMLFFDWLSLIAILGIGISLGCWAYVSTSREVDWTQIQSEHLAIYLFAAIVGSVSNVKLAWVKSERQNMMMSTLSVVAHELRTPILSIRNRADGIQHYFPILVAAYRAAERAHLDIPPLRQRQLAAIASALREIQVEADYSNTAINIVLMNARLGPIASSSYARQSMSACVTAAVTRFPYASRMEREAISLDLQDDFAFWGDELLMTHVLFNLLKNALYHVARARKGTIAIRLERGVLHHHLYFRDTGPGIPREILPHIFKRFFSWPGSDQDAHGLGIGLSFCQSVIDSFRGQIHCRSELGQYTEFQLTFPAFWERNAYAKT